MGKSSGSDRKGRPASSRGPKQPEWSSYMAQTIANTIDAYKKMSPEEKAKARKNLIEQYASRVNSAYRFGEKPQDSEHVRAAEHTAKQLGIRLPKIKDTESFEARYKAYKQAQSKKLPTTTKLNQKKKIENLPKFQDDGKVYDLNKVKKQVLKSMKGYNGRMKFVKFEKNYAGTYDLIYNSPYSKNVRMSWEDLKRQLK